MVKAKLKKLKSAILLIGAFLAILLIPVWLILSVSILAVTVFISELAYLLGSFYENRHMDDPYKDQFR
jgi:hypothetical protein